MNIFKIGKKTKELEDRVWKLEHPPRVNVGDDAFFYVGQGINEDGQEHPVYQKCKVAEISLYKEDNYRYWEYTVIYRGYIIETVREFRLIKEDPYSSSFIVKD